LMFVNLLLFNKEFWIEGPPLELDLDELFSMSLNMNFVMTGTVMGPRFANKCLISTPCRSFCHVQVHNCMYRGSVKEAVRCFNNTSKPALHSGHLNFVER
jgi:hypothetical protein